MPKKKLLVPRLPRDEKEIQARGFGRNCSESKKFITDGHSLALRKFVRPEFLKGLRVDDWRVKESKIAELWNQVAKRNHLGAMFIGCGQVTPDGMAVACLKDAQERLLVLDPYKLAFMVRSTGADTLAVDNDDEYVKQPLAICRKDTMVGMLMAMRFDSHDLRSYDLNSPGIPLNQAFVEKPVEVRL